MLRRRAEANKLPFGEDKVPPASTCTRILHRHNLILEEDTEKPASYQRFEKDRSNQLWEMDFKGDFLLDDETRCYPLTVVDDYSHFGVVLEACPNERHEAVKSHLSKAFRRYRLPERIITVRGAPWALGIEPEDAGPLYTKLSAWLVRLGIQVSFTARAHPQTNGKPSGRVAPCRRKSCGLSTSLAFRPGQERFKDWRGLLAARVPMRPSAWKCQSPYEVSARTYPEELPPVEYGPGDEVRQVNPNGQISFGSRRFKVGKAFGGHLLPYVR